MSSGSFRTVNNKRTKGVPRADPNYYQFIHSKEKYIISVTNGCFRLPDCQTVLHVKIWRERALIFHTHTRVHTDTCILLFLQSSLLLVNWFFFHCV